MRTTLNIDEDVLLAARAIAQRDKKSVGQVVTELARTSMEQQLHVLGFTTLPNRVRVEPVTNEMINRIRDEEGI